MWDIVRTPENHAAAIPVSVSGVPSSRCATARDAARSEAPARPRRPGPFPHLLAAAITNLSQPWIFFPRAAYYA